MTKDEALKLALEFVSDIQRGKYKGDAEETITAIKQALAAPVQKPLGFMNAGQVHEMQQGRLPYGYVYPKGGMGAEAAIYTTPPAAPEKGQP